MVEMSTAKKVFEDISRLPEFKMRIKKKQEPPTLTQGWSTDCAEVYSPPRVMQIASEMTLRMAWALDLTTIDPKAGMPWDFAFENKRKKRQSHCSSVTGRCCCSRAPCVEPSAP